MVSEGNPESKNPLTTRACSCRGARTARLQEEIALPEDLTGKAVRFGFEGVATWGGR